MKNISCRLKRCSLNFLLLGLLFLAACTSPSGQLPVPTPGSSSAVATTSGFTPTSSPFLPAESATSTPSPLPSDTPTLLPTSTSTLPPTGTPTPTSPPPVRFAVIGDYGAGNTPEQEVADLVKSWNPDFIVTTGDNNYPVGSADTIDDHIGRYYSEYIYPYKGKYAAGAMDTNRFFPVLGNHDWITDHAQPYLDYFTLPGNERYYDFTWGPLHFFALDSESLEPDGVNSSSVQAAWLQAGLSQTTSPWNLVLMHHPPYSSAIHGSTPWMQWPFGKWGATAVLAGHDHTYERILEDGLTYFVDGLGGGSRYEFQSIVDGSQVRYRDDYGAMLGQADANNLTLQFINVQGEVIDTWSAR